MAEQPHDVVAYAFAHNDGSLSDWEHLDGLVSTYKSFSQFMRFDVEWGWWDHIAIRLRNGQVIRVRPRRRPLPATARCE